MATYYKGDGTQITIPSASSVNTAQIVDNAVTYNKLSEEVQDQLDSGGSSGGESIRYTLSMSGNVITLTGSNGSTSSVTLPVYGGDYS